MKYSSLLRKLTSLNLLAYTDANWGGNANDQTSTPAYLIFFGPIFSCINKGSTSRYSHQAPSNTTI